LAEDDRHGYAIMQDIEERTGGPVAAVMRDVSTRDASGRNRRS
jgi:DNA-binding PadR family transcriptional regulator